MRTKMRVVIALILLFGGCQSQVQSDISLKTHIPCAPPCWQNIVPGTSSVTEVRARLESNPLVDVSTIKYSIVEEVEPPLAVISWRIPGKDQVYLQNGRTWQMEGRRNFVYFRDGKVLRIEVGLSGEITLAEIVEKYGPPERVYARIGTAEFIWYHTLFDYPAYGLRLGSFSLFDIKEAKDGTILIAGNMRITEACYYAPAPSVEEALREVFLFAPDQIEEYIANSQKWPGFVRVPIANWTSVTTNDGFKVR